MWIDRPRSETQIVGGNLPDKQLCVLFGVERFGPARISPGTAIRSRRVGDIPAVWLGHLRVLFFSDRRDFAHGSRPHKVQAPLPCVEKTIRVHRTNYLLTFSCT